MGLGSPLIAAGVEVSQLLATKEIRLHTSQRSRWADLYSTLFQKFVKPLLANHIHLADDCQSVATIAQTAHADIIANTIPALSP